MNACFLILQSKQTEDLGAAEEKLDHLNKIKAKLEQTLDELEDSLQSEKKARLDLDGGVQRRRAQQSELMTKRTMERLLDEDMLQIKYVGLTTCFQTYNNQFT